MVRFMVRVKVMVRVMDNGYVYAFKLGDMFMVSVMVNGYCQFQSYGYRYCYG